MNKSEHIVQRLVDLNTKIRETPPSLRADGRQGCPKQIMKRLPPFKLLRNLPIFRGVQHSSVNMFTPHVKNYVFGTLKVPICTDSRVLCNAECVRQNVNSQPQGVSADFGHLRLHQQLHNWKKLPLFISHALTKVVNILISTEISAFNFSDTIVTVHSHTQGRPGE